MYKMYKINCCKKKLTRENWTKICEYFTVYTIVQNSNDVLESLVSMYVKKAFSKKTDRIYSGVYYQRLSATLSPAAVYAKIVNVS